MELSQQTSLQLIGNLFERANDYADVAHSGFGEPNHGSLAGDDVVVLANYWCRCDKIDGLHSHEQHHPLTWAAFEAADIHFEWSDEWVVEYETGKAYRTCGDSYHWQPSLLVTDDGEYITSESDIDYKVEYALESGKCLTTNIVTADELVEAGFTLASDRNETGWHPGQDADPEKVRKEANANGLDCIFLLTENSQFYSEWASYTRPMDYEE